MTTGPHAALPGGLWIDAQLPPALVGWLATLGEHAVHVVELGLLAAADQTIFDAARGADAIVVTKDEDFVRLLEKHGPPPRVVWITVGNVRNAQLQAIVRRRWPSIRTQLAAGEPLIELAEASRA